MELFFTNKIDGNRATLESAESLHCSKVKRHSAGDIISFTDGKGNLYTGSILSVAHRETLLEITDCVTGYEKRDYYLHMAVAPTKNPDRYEWFIEKAVELGVDEITPLIADHSQRRIFNKERGERLILSAMKQSLKTKLPVLNPVKMADSLITQYRESEDYLKLIGHCREGFRSPLTEILSLKDKDNRAFKKILILIGPEGDFSAAETELALSSGFAPFHMGESRLRTESAALTAVTAVYLMHI